MVMFAANAAEGATSAVPSNRARRNFFMMVSKVKDRVEHRLADAGRSSTYVSDRFATTGRSGGGRYTSLQILAAAGVSKQNSPAFLSDGLVSIAAVSRVRERREDRAGRQRERA